MNKVNYNETVILPALQKRIQDLQNTNLALEVNLLLEQTKNKDLLASYEKDVGDLASRNNLVTSLKERIKSFEDIETKLKREISLKENILSEHNNLKIELEKVKLELQQLKDTPINTRRKKQD